MENIGISPSAFLIQLINFSIMVLVLGKLLFKPIIKILSERKKKIEQGLAYEEKMKAELELTARKREQFLERARDEARKIIEEGKKLGKKAESEILEKAKDEAAQVLAKGKNELETERAEMEKVLRAETAEIASVMVERLIGQVLKEADHKALIDQKLKDLSKFTK